MFVAEINQENKTIHIGHARENQATSVPYDITEWVNEFGDGAVDLVVQNPGAAEPHPGNLRRSGNQVEWIVADEDLTAAGKGSAQFRYTVGDTIVRSDTFTTTIDESLGKPGPIKPAEQGFIDQMITVKAQATQEIAQQTAQSEQKLNAIVGSAEAFSNSAEAAARDARQSEVNARQSEVNAEKTVAETQEIAKRAGLYANAAKEAQANAESAMQESRKNANSAMYDAEGARAWAEGTVDVNHPAHENSAKDWANKAQSSRLAVENLGVESVVGAAPSVKKEVNPDGSIKLVFTMPEGSSGPGTEGYTFTPVVKRVENGYEVSWTNDGGLPNPVPVVIPDGKDGLPGKDAVITPEIKQEVANAAAALVKVPKVEQTLGGSTTATMSQKAITDSIKGALQGGEIATIARYQEIAKIVQSGEAPNVFNIGDQIMVRWTGGGTTYDVPLDVVNFGNVELANGEVKPGMYLQWHYTVPSGVQFGQHQAFYYAETELVAGTYHVTIGNDWGKHCHKGDVWQFTLTQPVPQGGQLAGFRSAPGQDPTNWTVTSHASSTEAAALETAKVTSGAGGTSLGTLSFVPTEPLNSLQCCAYGHNRWATSAMRQWLNSKSAKSGWWQPQDGRFDRPPTELPTLDGFMAGFEDAFLSILKPVKVQTAANTVNDGGVTDATYDTFFLPSLEQMYAAPQAPGVEGEVWPYWKQALGYDKPAAWWLEHAGYITYSIAAKSAGQYYRLRSASRGSASYTWHVYPSGYLSSNSAVDSSRCAPACVIC